MQFGPQIIFIILIIVIIGICIFTYNVQSNQQNEINVLRTKLFLQSVKNTSETPQVQKPVNSASLVVQENRSGGEVIDETTIIQPSQPLADPVRVYDYRVLDDPMKDPKRRLPRYMLPSVMPSPAFNYPTRGWRDNFSLQGYLIDNKASTNDDNRVLQLFGRQKWPNSSQYEYYVTFQSGNQERKYELEKYTKELYDKDVVYVDILNNRKYEVKLFKQEGMEYNPFWF
ncbi:hypothetical protein Catovirus_2_220 [Catovirus CTV1]|uniref:Uncharacterized protein n=1 Tax=Catovirus CTV1 TaxID=1977631 RepID=A0A1V0SC65_9VIRU|nr:hypothetical protein Catovirus_2_220 [Catovirus CTV1]